MSAGMSTGQPYAGTIERSVGRAWHRSVEDEEWAARVSNPAPWD